VICSCYNPERSFRFSIYLPTFDDFFVSITQTERVSNCFDATWSLLSSFHLTKQMAADLHEPIDDNQILILPEMTTVSPCANRSRLAERAG
jgi:hypothetical protein